MDSLTFSKGSTEVKKFVEKTREKKVSTVRIIFPDKDQKLDKMPSGSQKATLIIKGSLASKTNTSDRNSFRATQKEEPLERIVREKVRDVSNTIFRAKRFTPNSSKVYCMSSEETRRLSVLTLESQSTMYGDRTLGPFDKRLGCLEEGKTCVTCFRKYEFCEGHRGYIPFFTPHINPLFQKEVINCLKCTCPYCGHVYATDDFIRAAGLNRLSDENYRKTLAEFTPDLVKLHNHPPYKRELYKNNMEDHKIMFVEEGDKSQEPTHKSISNIIAIFKNYTPEDLAKLRFTGSTHPLNFIMEGLLTIPPRLRMPGVVKGKHQDHFTTARYVDIIKYNRQLAENRNASSAVINQILSQQYSKLDEVFFGPESSAMGKNSEKEGIITSLGRKEGFLRKHVMGKRVDKSCRTVASPGVDGNFGEIGIPRSFAKTLMVTEFITEYNKDKVIEGILSGRYKVATLLTDGVTTKTNIDDKNRKTIASKVGIGNKVERSAEDGDIVLCGRQPTLHGESIMGFRIYLTDKEVIELCSPNNGPFNCDFDGDELSLHFIETVAAQVEALTVASTMHHIMSVQANRPMIGAAFHALLGAYLMTEDWTYPIENIEDLFEGKTLEEISAMKVDFETRYKNVQVKIPKERWVEALSVVNNSHRKRTLMTRCKRHGVDPYSGRALVSLAFPVNLTYIDSDLTIIDGILVKGVLKKSNIGTGSGSLVQVITKLFSVEEGCRFINDISKLTDWFIHWHSFSIGHQTFATNRDVFKIKVRNEINKVQALFYNLGPPPQDIIDLFHWKRSAHGILDQTQIFGKNVGNSVLAKSNSLNVLSGRGSGGKGSDMNTAQITSFLGPQKIKGDLQKPELNGKTRCLPMFLPNDCSLEATGVVLNSFFDGLTAFEMYFHMSSSREGLIDTANNTADIGYTHRRLSKGLEDTIVDNRGMVCSTSGRIFQFTLDGFNVAHQVMVKSPETGKTLMYADFKAVATMVNRLYEYISENGLGKRRRHLANS